MPCLQASFASGSGPRLDPGTAVRLTPAAAAAQDARVQEQHERAALNPVRAGQAALQSHEEGGGPPRCAGELSETTFG